MRLDTKPGELVRFTGEGGYQGERQRAREQMEVGKTYRVVSVDVGNFTSYVRVEGNKYSHNTVMFENVEATP